MNKAHLYFFFVLVVVLSFAFVGCAGTKPITPVEEPIPEENTERTPDEETNEVLSLDSFLTDMTWYITFESDGCYEILIKPSESFLLFRYPSDLSLEQAEQVTTDTYAPFGEVLKKSVLLASEEGMAVYTLPSDITVKELDEIHHGFLERLVALYYEEMKAQAQGSESL